MLELEHNGYYPLTREHLDLFVPVRPGVFMLAIRLFIWLASTYAPQSVHEAELGIVLFSVIAIASHIFVLKMAEKAS